jgi:hypothetical protein
MHPDGYVEYDDRDENIRETLNSINATRRKFIEPVYNFMQNVRGFEVKHPPSADGTLFTKEGKDGTEGTETGTGTQTPGVCGRHPL